MSTGAKLILSMLSSFQTKILHYSLYRVETTLLAKQGHTVHRSKANHSDFYLCYLVLRQKLLTTLSTV